MNNETPEAALRSRIADLEQQLKLSDEGCSRLAARCLDLEKEVQSYLAAHPQREMHTDSPTLLQPLLHLCLLYLSHASADLRCFVLGGGRLGQKIYK